MEEKPQKKDQLLLANNVLKLSGDLLKAGLAAQITSQKKKNIKQLKRAPKVFFCIFKGNRFFLSLP